MALTVIGFMHSSAEAQTKKHSYNQNYKVCRYGAAYAVCGDQHNPNARTASVTTQATVMTPPAAPAVPCNTVAANTMDNTVSMNSASAYTGYYRRHNIMVSDDANAPYQGEPSRQYDGPAKNEYRNMNVNQTSIYLPPNDGGR